jgi:hypothetical protein
VVPDPDPFPGPRLFHELTGRDSDARVSQHTVTVTASSAPPKHVKATLTLGGRAHRFERELAATPHLWLLIVIVYSYLALFALVVYVTVARP